MVTTTRACRCRGSRSACRRCRTRTRTTCGSRSPAASTWSRCRSSARPDDIELVHAIMAEVGVRLPVIAKIEKPEAVDDLDEIVRRVRRGDGGPRRPRRGAAAGAGADGAEAGRAGLPRQAKPVIVATQMLESMIERPGPTRAEASDVANAVLDGADAVMLSGETSVGRYPVQAVATMARIIASVEGDASSGAPRCGTSPRTRAARSPRPPSRSASRLGASALVAFTQTGDTARRLARLPRRSRCWPSPRTRPYAASSRCAGGSRRQHPDRASHRRDGGARSRTRSCWPTGGAGPATRGDRGRQPAGDRPVQTNTLRVHRLAPRRRDESGVPALSRRVRPDRAAGRPANRMGQPASICRSAQTGSTWRCSVRVPPTARRGSTAARDPGVGQVGPAGRSFTTGQQGLAGLVAGPQPEADQREAGAGRPPRTAGRPRPSRRTAGPARRPARMWSCRRSAPYQRSTAHSFSARNRRPSGTCQSR